MVFFGHAATGAIVGVASLEFAPDDASNLAIGTVAFIIGVISHYIADFIPHGHYNFSYKNLSLGIKTLGLDVLVGSFLLLPLIFNSVSFAEILVIFTAMIGALLPDVWMAAREGFDLPLGRLLRAEKKLHMGVHWHSWGKNHLANGARAWSWTDIWQVAVWLVALYLVINF